MSVKPKIEPIVKTLRLNASSDKAFHHFTDNIHVWWAARRSFPCTGRCGDSEVRSA